MEISDTVNEDSSSIESRESDLSNQNQQQPDSHAVPHQQQSDSYVVLDQPHEDSNVVLDHHQPTSAIGAPLMSTSVIGAISTSTPTFEPTDLSNPNKQQTNQQQTVPTSPISSIGATLTPTSTVGATLTPTSATGNTLTSTSIGAISTPTGDLSNQNQQADSHGILDQPQQDSHVAVDQRQPAIEATLTPASAIGATSTSTPIFEPIDGSTLLIDATGGTSVTKTATRDVPSSTTTGGSTSPTDSTGDSEGALDESDDVSEPLQQDSDGIVDEQPAFDGVQQVDPQGPHGVVNQQQTVPLTIWQRFTRMFRSTPPPLVSPLEPNVYVTRRLMERIENLEKRRDDLHKEEMKADSRCDEVSQFLLSNLGSYMLMSGAMAMGGVFSSPVPVIFHGLLIVHAVTFILGFGTCAYLSHSKIKRMGWVFNFITRKRFQLEAATDELANDLVNAAILPRDEYDPTVSVLTAKGRVGELKDSLQSRSGALKKHHIWHIRVTWVVGVFYLILVLVWLLFVQQKVKGLMRGKDLWNILMSQSPQYMAAQ